MGRPSTSKPQRSLPQNLDAERNVLGACLLHGVVVPGVAALVRPTDFYLHRHRLIFAAILATHDARGAVDPILVGEELFRRGQLEEVGGNNQLLDLLESVVTAVGVEAHAEVVREHAQRRAYLELARRIEQGVADHQDLESILVEVERHLRDASRVAASAALSPADVIAQWGVAGPLIHVPTGFSKIDEATGGGPPFGARCYILGAPDAGKTAFLVQVADYFLTQGIDVGFLAIDEEPGDVLMRFLQRRGFARPACEQRNAKDLADMAAAMSEAGLALYDDESTIESAMGDFAARAKRRGRPGAFFIDSIQTARSANELEGASMHSAVTLRTRAIRAATTANKFVTYATSEMSRAAYRSLDGADRISDMAAAKESGAIEYTARFMLSLRSVAGQPDLIEAAIAKNKFGPRTREGEPGLHLRLDRATQTLTEDVTFVAQTKAGRDGQRAEQQNKEALADAAALALVIVDEPGIAKSDAEDEVRRKASCGTRRCKSAFSALRKAIITQQGAHNRKSLFLDGTKVPLEVLELVDLAERPRVQASQFHQLHPVAPACTTGSGAPADELHHHHLRSSGGAARKCRRGKKPVPPPAAGETEEGRP